MKKINIYLTISLIITSFLLGITLGFMISPSYQQTMFEREDMGLGKADRYVDLRYLNQMIAHHKAAIMLAEQVVNKSKRQEIRDLTAEIIKSEPQLIDSLYALKKKYYSDTQKVKDPIVAVLGPSDDKIDLRFLNALIFHHRQGIEMTQEIRTKSSRSDVLNDADAVEEFLTNSLNRLEQWREQWYSVEQ